MKYIFILGVIIVFFVALSSINGNLTKINDKLYQIDFTLQQINKNLEFFKSKRQFDDEMRILDYQINKEKEHGGEKEVL